MKRLILGSMIIAGLLVSGMPCHAAKVVQVKGSDTLINMVQRMAEVYMESNPGKMLAVTGGGSGTGIAAIINKGCDIADASRLIKDSEIAQAVAGGVDVKRVVVAIDALSVIVNASNTVQELTVDEVGKIYRGEVKNWKDFGGEDRPITLYGRQPNSGTYDFMKENVLKAEYSGKMNQMNGNAQIVEAIKQDKGGIGYVGLGYLKEATGIAAVKVALKAGGVYVDPLDMNDVKTGKYPITRALNQYVNGMPKGDVLDFIRFELSAEGQKIVAEEGFLPLNEEYQSLNSWITG
jgi:phosphate transport system substrate-binding protein